MRLRGRLIAADGEPWVVALVVDEAEFYSHDLARARVRAEEVSADDSRRRNPRIPASISDRGRPVHNDHCRDRCTFVIVMLHFFR